MSVEFGLNDNRRVRYTIAGEADYNTSLSGSQTFYDIKLTEAEFSTDEEFLDNETMTQRRNAYLPKILSGRKRCSFTATGYICGTGVPVSGSTYAARSPFTDTVKTMMGGVFFTSGSATDGSLASGSFSTSAPLDKFAGSAVGLVNASSGRLEVARVKSFDTASGDLVLEHALPFIPTNGQAVYGATNIFSTEDPKQSLQILFEGQVDDDKFVGVGLQGGFGLDFTLDGLATISYELEGSNWTFGAPGTLQEANHSDGDPIPLLDSRVYFYEHPEDSVTAGNAVCLNAPAWELTPTLEWIDLESSCSPTGIIRKRAARAVPIAAGSVTVYMTDLDWFTARSNDTRYGMAIQLGSQPGNTVYISAPYVQIIDVQRTEVEGVNAVQVSFEVLENEHAVPTGTNLDLARAALSIHSL